MVYKAEISAISGTVPINEARLIGVVKEYIHYSDIAVSRHTGRTRVIFEHNMDLGTIESVDSILETIRL